MFENPVGNRRQIRRGHRDAMPDLAVLLHDFPFRVIQRRRFEQNTVGDADFADIVEMGE